MRHRFIASMGALWALLSCALGASGTAAAQAPVTGWELALSGSRSVVAGRSMPLRGVTFQVRGLSSLEAEAAEVRARFASRMPEDDGPWTSTSSDPDGRFTVAVPVPEDAGNGEPRLEVEVGPDRRRFRFPVEVLPAETVDLLTDRQLYEPGETVHIWGLLRDESSFAPLGGMEFELALTGTALPPIERLVQSRPSGAFHLAVPTTPETPLGQTRVEVRRGGRVLATARFAVGTRTYDRMLVEVDTGEGPVAPGARREVAVAVHTPDGSAISGAEVQATVGDAAPVTGVSGADGVARLTVRAPRHLGRGTREASVSVEARHPGLGAVSHVAPLPLAVPEAYSVELLPSHGGLLPEVEESLLVRLYDAAQEPPPTGTRVTLRGAMFPDGQAEGRTDDDGLFEVPATLPRGASMRAEPGRFESPVHVRVHLPGARPRRQFVRVLERSRVAPSLDRQVAAPGEPIAVDILRRGDFSGEVVVEMRFEQRPLVVRYSVPPARGPERVTFAAPATLGWVAVRVRPVLASEVHEGDGGTALVLVRPASADMPRLDPERSVVPVGETARLRLQTGAGRPGHAAVLVRDLAAHAGEVPFQTQALSERIDRELRAASGGTSPLLRAAVRAVEMPDAADPPIPARHDRLGLPNEPDDDLWDERGPLRDPYRMARILERSGIDALMVYAEEALEHALGHGSLSDVVEGDGPQRRFRGDLFRDRDETTLGGGAITPAILTAAASGFSFERVALRVARHRLLGLMLALAEFLDPGEEASVAERMASRAPPSRWGPMLTAEMGPHALDDPWGGRFELRATRAPRVVLGTRASAVEWVSAGPDGRFGTSDDLRDPFARVVPRATAYADASGEDELMREIAVLPVGRQALERMQGAFARTRPEMAEDAIGDLVSAETVEGEYHLGGLGLHGRGAGGGGGSGYGRGSGGSARVRSGRAALRMAMQANNLGRLVRERFPPTLLFQPEVALAPSGVTAIEVPLADAVTRYVVEVIVWRPDGWITSTRAHVDATRELVVEAPVPQVVHLGDALELPLRVSNRGTEATTVQLSLVGDAALGVPDAGPFEVEVGANDAAVVPVSIAPTELGEGALSVMARAADGTVLDAVRRVIAVRPLNRRDERRAGGVADGALSLTLEVPREASPRSGSVSLRVGPGLLPGARSGPWARWPGRGTGPTEGHAERRALAISERWSDDEVDDEELSELVFELTQSLSTTLSQTDLGVPQLRTLARTLLALSPVHRASGRRSERVEVRSLIERIRERVASRSVSVGRGPRVWVLCAAALAQTGGDPSRVRELLRRVEPFVVAIGDDRWVVGESGRLEPTLLAALAEVGIGRRQAAFAYVATVGRWAGRGHSLGGRSAAFGRAVVTQLMAGPAVREARLTIDGETVTVPLDDGAARYDAAALARPGRHTVVVQADAPVWVEAVSRHGIPYRASTPGPLAVQLEGEVGALDRISGLRLDLQNRTARTLPGPVVELTLPTGAELDREAPELREIAWNHDVTVEGDVLVLRLPPLLPGQRTGVPLPLRWTVAGRLRGLGVVASDPSGVRPVVLPPRLVHIAEPEGSR